jgi:uncharacterized protein YdeI (YjbR/CyaY-like superfamily)
MKMGRPLQVKDREGWRAWLEENHAAEKEVWLVLNKKHVAGPGICYEDAVEEAICFGWIDGILKRIDDRKHVLRYSPRRRGSIWSETNKRRAERMVAQGRMTEAGLARIEEAKENGQWDRATLREDEAVTPPDLHAALKANRAARRGFERLAPSRRKQYLWWIASAKTVQTRQKRIRETVRLAADAIRELESQSVQDRLRRGGR